MGQNKFAGKKILIYGFAREGSSTLKYLRKYLPEQKIYITDDRPMRGLPNEYRQILRADKNIEFIEGIENRRAQNLHFDVVIKTPGKPNKSLPTSLRPMVTNQTQIFLEQCKGIVIGITGTKGKSTTASLIDYILQKSGKESVLLGNIGKPPLDYLDHKNNRDTIFVFEMSSHQLSNVTISPHIAVILNFYPEHLDYYESLEDYAAAKANITKFQSKNDYLIYNRDNKTVREISQKSKAIKISFGTKDVSELSDLGKTRLMGQMNKLNILAAKKVTEVLEISPNTIFAAVKSFSPLEHRLELVGVFKGITFYNDSLATIPEATIAALDTLSDRVETLFVGGFDRGIDYTLLVQRLLTSRIKNLILFPTTGEKIWQKIVEIDPTAKSRFQTFPAKNMAEGVKLAYQHTTKGKIALLSCATTSFSIFKDYADRGDQFKKYVQEFGKK